MAEQLTNDDRIDRLERAVRWIAGSVPPGVPSENVLSMIQAILTPPEEKKPLLKWAAVHNGWIAASKRHRKGVPFYLYRVSKKMNWEFSIATSDAELLGDGGFVTFDSKEKAKACCERLEASGSSPKKPEEKKPPKPLSFDDWAKAREVVYLTREDAWNASRRNTKKDMSRLLMSNDFRDAGAWLEEYNWGTSDGDA